jgi:predicted nucleic acid-binding protein
MAKSWSIFKDSRKIVSISGFMRKQIKPLYITYAIGERYATLRRHMRQNNIGLIGDIDTYIAATALVHGLSVVTVDSDFSRVPGLATQIVSKADLR